MASVKRYILDTDGGLTSSGTNTITITTNRSISSGHQAAGFSLRFKAGGTNTGAATLNVDSLGAVAIKRLNGDALSAGDIVSGGIYDVAFDGTNYQLLGTAVSGGSYGTLSGANTWSGTNTFTGNVTVGDGSGDTIVIKGTTVSAFVASILSSADAAAFRSAIGLGTIATQSSPLPVANGGTGQTTAAAGARALLDGLGTTKGNILWYNTSWTVLAPP